MIRCILSRLVRAGTGLLGLVVLLAGCHPLQHSGTSPTPGPPSNVIASALGRLEPYDGVIAIIVPPGEQVMEVKVPTKVDGGESWHVERDQELVVLTSKEMREKEVLVARAQLEAAQKQLAAIQASGQAQLEEARLKQAGLQEEAKSDIKSLELKVGLLKEQFDSAEQDFQRMKDLSRGTVSEQDLARQKLAVRAAQVDWESARIALDRSKEAQKRSEKEARAKMEALEKSVERAKAEVPVKSSELNQQLAQLRYQASLVLSPIKGEVLDLLVHKGDTVGTRPLMRLGDLSKLAVIAEVDENDILKVKMGAKAAIKSFVINDTLKIEHLQGEVTNINRAVGRNHLFDINPAAVTDKRVVEVKIRLLGLKDLTEEQRAGLKRIIGHQVYVDIER